MKIKRISLCLLGIFFLFPVLASADGLADPLDHWKEKTPFSRGAPFRISYGDGRFVAAGESGTLYTSSDGADWKERSSGTDRSLKDVAYGGTILVAVGERGTVLSSPDGVVWTGRNSGTGYDLNGVGYGQGAFVAVGDGGIILTSVDGLTWLRGDSGTHQGFNKIAYGKDIFVVVGKNGTVLTSPDGAVWTLQVSGTHHHLEGIAYGKDTFVAVGETILTSSDGKAWTERIPETSHRILGVAYGSGFFAAVAENGAILTSADGADWTLRDTGTRRTLRAIAHGKGMFLAAGERGTLLQSETLPSPQITVSSTSLNFGSVAVGQSSSTTLTATNSGSADLIIRQITISGANAVNFTTQNDSCTGTTLSSAQNCSLRVVFSPNSSGAKNATLSISSNDPVTPNQTVSLNGSGTGSDSSIIVASGSSGSFCFFSNSVKGTGLEDYLDVLRKFRDAVLSRSHWGRKLIDFYYEHSPALNRLLAGHDSLKKAVAVGLVPSLAALAYVTLHTSPAEKAILLLLMAGAMTAGWRLIRRSTRAQTFMHDPQPG
jgi:hypothetical protein